MKEYSHWSLPVTWSLFLEAGLCFSTWARSELFYQIATLISSTLIALYSPNQIESIAYFSDIRSGIPQHFIIIGDAAGRETPFTKQLGFYI
jgi:hypothetical protein